MKFNIKLLNLKRRRRKYLYFSLNIEPKSKKTTTNKSEIQSKFVEKMKTSKMEGLKSKVAIEITAYTNLKNPPQIEKFVKNIIDKMHKKQILRNQKDEIYLPFEDDRFIKYLRVEYVFIKGKSHIHIKIRPFSSFISDIHFVDTEIGLNYKTDINTNNNSWAEYKDLIDNKEKYIKILSEEAYGSMLKIKTLDIQKEICDGMSITPEIIQLLYPKQSNYVNNFKDIYRDWASILLNVPIRIHLPGIPLNEDEGNDYKAKYREKIKKNMRQYLAKHSIFDKLQSPILISVFYMPPRKKKKDYKDIDNIMLEYIMPAINEVFYPPISLFNIGMEDRKSNEIHELSISIPRSLNGSAIGYEVIELPYNFTNSNTGFLKVGFRIEIIESSVMRYIDDEIDKYMTENKYV